MAYFHLKLVPSRSGFPHDATGEEMAAMQQHAAFEPTASSACASSTSEMPILSIIPRPSVAGHSI
jgi:hypothetical protein